MKLTFMNLIILYAYNNFLLITSIQTCSEINNTFLDFFVIYR